MFKTFFIRVRAFVTNPIVEWGMAILNFLVALVALLTLVAHIPVLPPEVATTLLQVIVWLDTVIALLRRLIPAQ